MILVIVQVGKHFQASEKTLQETAAPEPNTRGDQQTQPNHSQRHARRGRKNNNENPELLVEGRMRSRPRKGAKHQAHLRQDIDITKFMSRSTFEIYINTQQPIPLQRKGKQERGRRGERTERPRTSRLCCAGPWCRHERLHKQASA